MPQSFIFKLYSETQVSGRLGMSGGISPRHAQNPLSILLAASIDTARPSGQALLN